MHKIEPWQTRAVFCQVLQKCRKLVMKQARLAKKKRTTNCHAPRKRGIQHPPWDEPRPNQNHAVTGSPASRGR
jgi:hypothetical protein